MKPTSDTPAWMRTTMVAALLVMGCGACGGGGGAVASDLSVLGDATVATDLPTAPAPTYASFAQSFFTTYCVSCHPSASSTRDFMQYATITANAHNIACGVSPTARAGCTGNPAPAQFPIGNGPHPTDAERNELVLWIENGLPQ